MDRNSAPTTAKERDQVIEAAIDKVVEDQWKPNGCTGVPDIWVECCNEHDVDYYEGILTRAEADAKFRRCMQAKSIFGRWSPMAFWRWCGVRMFGRFFHKPKGRA